MYLSVQKNNQAIGKMTTILQKKQGKFRKSIFKDLHFQVKTFYWKSLLFDKRKFEVTALFSWQKNATSITSIPQISSNPRLSGPNKSRNSRLHLQACVPFFLFCFWSGPQIADKYFGHIVGILTKMCGGHVKVVWIRAICDS